MIGPIILIALFGFLGVCAIGGIIDNIRDDTTC